MTSLRQRLHPFVKSVRLAGWSMRKMQLPIKAQDIVLDVGSGGNPHPRSDVLLERYASGQHRHGAQVVANRPMVFADACHMPFKDKAFDYVIAFHVLEHVSTPDLFLRELMRVAKAGYIETPNVMFERVRPYGVHCLEVMNVRGRLLIHKKSAPKIDPYLENVFDSPRWHKLFYHHPEFFHVCYHWKDRIDFEIANPDEACSWHMRDTEDADNTEPDPSPSTAANGSRGSVIEALRRFYCESPRSI
jgi:SAM-dependent methyltransferase